MEYPIGIEMTPDYLSYEVSKAAYKLVKEMMLVEPGENVVVTGDTSTAVSYTHLDVYKRQVLYMPVR